jgi:hypothetical protein
MNERRLRRACASHPSERERRQRARPVSRHVHPLPRAEASRGLPARLSADEDAQSAPSPRRTVPPSQQEPDLGFNAKQRPTSPTRSTSRVRPAARAIRAAPDTRATARPPPPLARQSRAEAAPRSVVDEVGRPRGRARVTAATGDVRQARLGLRARAVRRARTVPASRWQRRAPGWGARGAVVCRSRNRNAAARRAARRANAAPRRPPRARHTLVARTRAGRRAPAAPCVAAPAHRGCSTPDATRRGAARRARRTTCGCPPGARRLIRPPARGPPRLPPRAAARRREDGGAARTLHARARLARLPQPRPVGGEPRRGASASARQRSARTAAAARRQSAAALSATSPAALPPLAPDRTDDSRHAPANALTRARVVPLH